MPGGAGKALESGSPVAKAVSGTLDSIGYGKFQMSALILTGGIMFAEGAEMLVMGSVTTLLHDHWDLPALVRGGMVSIVFVGFSLGNFISGQIGDRWGRRQGVLTAYALIGICGFLTGCATSPAMMLALRFMVGFGCGIGFPAVYSLIPELCPTWIRGTMCTLMIGFMPLGELYAACGVLLFDPTLSGSTEHCDRDWYYPSHGLINPGSCSWKALSEFSAIPALVLFVLSYLYLPESPYFLATTGRFADLEEVLEDMAQVNGKDIDMTSIRACYSEDCSAVVSPSPATTYSLGGVLQQMFAIKFRSTALFLCVAHFVKDFSVFGLSYALPQFFRFLNDMTVGLQLVVMASLAVPGVIAAILLTQIPGIGYIRCLAGSACTCSLFSLGMLEVTPDNVAIVSANIVKALSLCYFVMTVVYTTEVFPTAMRNTAVGMCTCAGRLGSIAAPLLFELALHKSRSTDSFMLTLFVCMGAVGASAPLCLTRETKGQSLEEIDPVAMKESSKSGYGAVASTA